VGVVTVRCPSWSRLHIFAESGKARVRLGGHLCPRFAAGVGRDPAAGHRLVGSEVYERPWHDTRIHDKRTADDNRKVHWRAGRLGCSALALPRLS
jgi:hypothetical protein